MMRRSFWMMVVVALAAGCGSDKEKSGNNATPQECAEGERWNPILARCAVETGNNGGTTGSNNGDNNGGTNANNGANNGGNNGTTGSNNGTSGTNNDTTSNNNGQLACGVGELVGKACAPSGELLAAADVTVSGTDCATGMPFELTTRTGSDGTFTLSDIPAGNHNLRVHTGSFDSNRPVLIQADMTTDLTSAADKVCLDQNVKIGVIEGAYDHVEGVLNTLNLDYSTVGNDSGDQATIAFLSDLNAMNEYDIIFINCGDLWDNVATFDFSGTTDTIAGNLRAYVQGGKSLYVSDWAAPFLERAFPDMIDFLGEDTMHGDARKGYAPQTISATVLTPELQSVLGRSDAEIIFPQDAINGVINNNWAVAAGAGAGSSVQLAGDAALCGQGSFIEPCPSGGGTQAAAPLLVTYKDPSGGTAVFTSFHNERQSSLNQDMEVILRFLIFQL